MNWRERFEERFITNVFGFPKAEELVSHFEQELATLLEKVEMPWFNKTTGELKKSLDTTDKGKGYEIAVNELHKKLSTLRSEYGVKEEV